MVGAGAGFDDARRRGQRRQQQQNDRGYAGHGTNLLLLGRIVPSGRDVVTRHEIQRPDYHCSAAVLYRCRQNWAWAHSRATTSVMRVGPLDSDPTVSA